MSSLPLPPRRIASAPSSAGGSDGAAAAIEAVEAPPTPPSVARERAELLTHRLVALEETVRDAIARRRYDGLRILGYGEISCVIEWDGLACKRVAPFGTPGAALSYRACVNEYVAGLRGRGVDVLETQIQICTLAGSRPVAYCVQPRLPATAEAAKLFARMAVEEIVPRFDLILAHVSAVVDERLGLDAQLSNWAFMTDQPVYFDVTTPFMRGPDLRTKLDTEVFLATLPLAVRAGVKRFLAARILGRYHEPRRVICDLLANLHKEGLGHLLPRLLPRANLALGTPLSLDEICRYRVKDARVFAGLRSLRRLEAGVKACLGRSSNGVLLPPSIGSA